MSYDIKTTNELILLRQQEATLQLEIARLSKKHQLACTHDVVVECRILPLRLCRHCKLEEEGWKGYKRLVGDRIARISFEQYRAFKDEELISTVKLESPVHS